MSEQMDCTKHIEIRIKCVYIYIILLSLTLSVFVLSGRVSIDNDQKPQAGHAFLRKTPAGHFGVYRNRDAWKVSMLHINLFPRPQKISLCCSLLIYFFLGGGGVRGE